MPSYHTLLLPVSGLPAVEARRMLELYASLYHLPDPRIFQDDLAAKDEVLQLWHGEQLVGFTTLQIYDVVHEGRARRIVYSGDTVVDRAHWGQQALARAWISRIGDLRRQAPEIPIYWLLVVKGHRTYRFLSAFCTRFHPHRSIPAPDLAAFADVLASARFGTHYDASLGVVRHPSSRGHLREEVAAPADRERDLPEVAYFLQRNPGYREGHELVCLFEFTPEAMKPLTRRIFEGRA